MNERCMGCMNEIDENLEFCPICGYQKNSKAREAYHLSPGTFLNDRYIIGKVLGFGGFGVTYIGYDTVLQKTMAIKEYLPGDFSTRLPDTTQVTVFSGERTEQFLKGMRKVLDEAKRLARFQGEPGIVSIYDFFEDNQTAYIVMEYLDGETLKSRIDREGKIPPKEAAEIVQKVINALKKVHEARIIHRDLSPDNIYLLKNGDVKVIDFGAARQATSTQNSKSLSVLIKQGFSPEEQYGSRGVQGTWTDVYALAATYYKMLTGVTPPDAMERMAKDTIKRPSNMGISLPKNTEAALMNALHVKIEDRTQTMEDFEKELGSESAKERVVKQKREDIGKIPVLLKLVFALCFVGLITSFGMIYNLTIAPAIQRASLPKGQIYVPNFLNMTREDAIKRGNKEGLEIVVDRMKYSSSIPEGLVTAQSVMNGQIVPQDTKILVEISQGKEKVIMPILEGMEEEKAEKILGELGIMVKKIPAESEIFAEGAIVFQGKEVNQAVIKGDTVELGVAGAKQIREEGYVDSPDVLLKHLNEVKEKLITDEIFLIVDEYKESSQPFGTILSQDVPAMTQIKKGTVIHITLSAPKESVIMPSVIGNTPNEAMETLKNVGLSVRTEEGFFPGVDVGRVAEQVGEEDGDGEAATVVKGSEVLLRINNGIDPNAATAAESAGESTSVQRTNSTVTRTTAARPATTAAPATTATTPATTAETTPGDDDSTANEPQLNTVDVNIDIDRYMPPVRTRIPTLPETTPPETLPETLPETAPQMNLPETAEIATEESWIHIRPQYRNSHLLNSKIFEAIETMPETVETLPETAETMPQMPQP